MKQIVLFFCLSLSLWAYRAGDTIKEDLASQLEIKKDKVYIVDFFASWCISCKHELPLIENMSKKLDKEQVEVIGVDVDEDIKKANEFQKNLKLGFKIINDPKGDIVKVFDPIGMPAIYIVKDMEIKEVIFGARENIDEVLMQKIKNRIN